MLFHRIVLRTANSLFNLVVITLLVIGGSYSAFALWDNERVYSAAGDVQADMIKLKPDVIISEEDEGADFSELLAVNEDVCGWITMDNTNIDFPIVQGETNLTYVNMDVYGSFALAGSIFIDSRNHRDFSDPYNLLYGHHMADGQMFGDLDLYKNEEFFNANRTGTLILPDNAFNLEVIACLVVRSSDEYVFRPSNWQGYNINNLLNYAKRNALFYREELVEQLLKLKDVQLLALSTCSYEFTDARTIVLTVMNPYSSDELGGQEE